MKYTFSIRGTANGGIIVTLNGIPENPEKHPFQPMIELALKADRDPLLHPSEPEPEPEKDLSGEYTFTDSEEALDFIQKVITEYGLSARFRNTVY
jgi:hypothetical protein